MDNFTLAGPTAEQLAARQAAAAQETGYTDLIPGINVGNIPKQIINSIGSGLGLIDGHNYDVLEDYTFSGRPGQVNANPFDSDTYGLRNVSSFPTSGTTDGTTGGTTSGATGGTTSPTGYTLTPEQQYTQQAAAQQAAQNTQNQNFNRGYLNDQYQMLLAQLGRLDSAQTAGMGKIGTQYDAEVGKSEMDRDRQTALYEDSRLKQGQGKEKAFGEANKSANNAFRSLSQIIGRGAGTGSSAFNQLLPDVLGQGLNQNRGSAIENYSQNMQGIKKSEDQYGLDFAQVLQELLDQRTQQENTFKGGIEGQRQNVYGQQATNRGEYELNNNPNASYETIRNSQNKYRDQIDQSYGKIAGFDAYTPEFKRGQAVAQAPNINEYTTNRASINAQNQGQDPSNVYSNILRKRLQEGQ